MTDAINPLHALAGEWLGEETIAPTRWGPGGTATSRVRTHAALGGRVLVQEYAAERDGKP